MKHGPGEVFLIGDLNVALNVKRSSSERIRVNRELLLQLLTKHGLTQNVESPTHEQGSLLDVVCCSEYTPVRVKDTGMSDHSLLTWYAVLKPNRSKRQT